MSSWKCRVSCTMRPPSSRTRGLPLDLEPDRALHRAQRVDVLGLGPGAPRAAPGGAIEVLTSQRSEPSSIRTSETPSDAQQLAQLGDVGPGDLGGQRAGAGHRLGDHLDQRDAGPVVVDQRVVGAVDPAGGAADVQRLAGVLLEVDPLDADPDRPAVARSMSSQPSVHSGSSYWRDLEVLGHVRVEVVLPREPAPGRDASSSAPGRSGWCTRSRRGWPPAASRAGPGRPGRPAELGSAPKTVGQPQNILVDGAQLDVRLQADHRLVPGQGLVVGRERSRPRAG